MNALAFLIRKQFVNFFRDLARHPAKLVTYVISFGFIIFALLMPGAKPSKSTPAASDIRILHGIYLGVLLLLCIPSLLSALKSGTTMFKMSDVNFLFVSPISPKHILNYGLLKQMGATLLMFVFMLCYSGMLMENFHIGPSGVVLLLLGLVAALFLTQVISLLIYSYANGSPDRQKNIRSALILFFGAMALVLLYVFRQNGSGLSGLYAAFASPLLEYFPVIGWAKGMTFAFLGGNLPQALIYAALLVGLFAAALTVFERSDPDYYEDVLQSTERQFEAKQAAKDHRVTQQPTNRKTRVGKTGLGKGWGADAFFYKHLCEARRRSSLVFISTSTVVTLLADLALCFIITSSSKGDASAPTADLLLIIIFAADLYILFLMNAMGDWSRELSKPYIYLVPEKPFTKLVWASMTSILKPAVDGALFFSVLCIAVHANPLSALICFLAYVSFGLLFLSGNVLAQRTMGSIANRGFVAVLYMFLLFLLMAPGIAAGIVIYWRIQTLAAAFFLAGLPVVGWNLLVSFVILFCCRNLLSDCEASAS